MRHSIMNRPPVLKPGKVIVAGRLAGRVAAREIVLPTSGSWMRWCEHDYPTSAACWNHYPEYELQLIREGTGKVIVGDYIGKYSAGRVAMSAGANVWSAAILQAKCEGGRLVCANVFGLCWRGSSWP
jgi:hypothetical protein